MAAAPTLLPPWWDRLPETLSLRQDCPAAVDVVVIGGGLAGLSAARSLALGGARVALLEARAVLGDGISLRSPGSVRASLGEHPGRLIGAVGQAAAQQMHDFLASQRAALLELGLFEQTGSLAVGAMENEADELRASIELLTGLGVPCDGWTETRVNDALGSVGFGPGRFVPGDGQVDPVGLVERLAADARKAGATLCVSARVERLVEEHDGWHARGPGFDVCADAVVLAAGHGLAELVPWFRDTVFSVRHQWLATRGPDTTAAETGVLPLPVTGQHGFSTWTPVGARVVAGGARFGTVEMEAGETDDTVVQPRIDHILRSNLGRFFPRLAEVEITHAWTAIATHSCDGLPFIGPLPGQVQLVACTGWQGLDHSIAVRAGQAVAQGLLTGHAPGVPRLFTPGRMV